MTNQSISLIDLAEKYAGTDFMREMGERALHRLMDLENVLHGDDSPAALEGITKGQVA